VLREPVWWMILSIGLLLLVLGAVGTIPGYVSAAGIGLLALSWAVFRSSTERTHGD